MLRIKITIEQITEKTVEFKIERFENGRWKFFDMYETDSQSASSRLIWEREKASNGVFDLEVVDKRTKFVLV